VSGVQEQVEDLWKRTLLRARVGTPPHAVTLLLAGEPCGSADPLVAASIAGGVPGFRLDNGCLELGREHADAAARSRKLEEAARWLLQVGFVSPWRDEALDVRGLERGDVLARIDRCAVRALGITTYSVHLNGYFEDGRMVVARRAANKRVDPGMWDNLTGGLISAGESALQALEREAYEEAGLRTAGRTLTTGSRLRVSRPLADGLLCEIVQVFDIELPADTRLSNLDGEVECFEVRAVPAVLEGIARAEFTVEASLAVLDSLRRRAGLPPEEL
jgi:8-oxo-dGTP pyrophosphatase MutT (NUDIX family)